VKEKFYILLLSSITFSLILISLSVYTIFAKEKVHSKKVLGVSTSKLAGANPNPPNTPTPFPLTSTPIPTVHPNPTPTTIPATTTNNPQYTAQKVGDSTWRIINIKNDSQMASSQDIFNALNSYRSIHGAGNLSWDDTLANFAQSRANTFTSINGLDGHSGFKNFMNNDGFSKLGFNYLGENSAYLGGPMNGERIIKEIFGADSTHDNNQLDPSWQYIGVGINGNAVNINFGKNKR
jgi:uncharacterized protein YkwD